MHLRHVWLVLTVAGACAQTTPPVQIIRGELLLWQVRGLAGEMAIRLSDGQAQTCQVTPDTYITRQTIRITPVAVKPGDWVEVVGDRRAGNDQCTAVTIYVRPPEPKPRPKGVTGRAPIPIPQPRLMDNLYPRGRLTYAGTVLSQNDKRIVVRTRKDGDKSFALRDDTIFSDSGREVQARQIDVHTHVFLRAGQTFDGDLEVYQIIWGDILQPDRPSAP
ncbi:MAG: hypothetical protein IT168_28700 [Bryobacterales bacterium]|nr:hypothetical protein [Bryobacterales bacterium]